MQIAKAIAMLAISMFVVTASLYQLALLLLITAFDLFSDMGRYISFVDEPLLAVVQVPLYLVFLLFGSIGTRETFSDR
jgi:hypothetical protein